MATSPFNGRVALVTGAARGQGRAIAELLARRGANLILVDVCADVPTSPYPMSTEDDLERTAAAARTLGAEVWAEVADVRNFAALSASVAAGVEELGRLDFVVANAGVYSIAQLCDLTEDAWQDMIDVNLTGVWHTIKAAVPHVRHGGQGGAVVLTSSAAGMGGAANIGHYVAAKHGVQGLMKTLANELAAERIRVNTVNPTQVNTAMIHNEATYRLFRPDLDNPTADDFRAASLTINALPVPWVEPADVAAAVAFLLSDEAQYITGVALPVDAGILNK
jgi:(+)-trans-carveol dehydrogenase